METLAHMPFSSRQLLETRATVRRGRISGERLRRYDPARRPAKIRGLKKEAVRSAGPAFVPAAAVASAAEVQSTVGALGRALGRGAARRAQPGLLP